MIISKHISYYYSEDRLQYLNKIIHETNSYCYETNIFIHTNENMKIDQLISYTNGSIHIIYHDLTNINPYYLTWKCRSLLYDQRNQYDIFMYIEDDILVPSKAIEYWLRYNEDLIEMNYNLGFVRIEKDNNNIEYITDLANQKFDKFLQIKNFYFCINDKNPYCAFWIYNKKEFNNFVNNKLYNVENINGYGIREMSAIGLHGKYNNWYKHTLIPMVDGKLIDDCKIYHLPNNYVTNKSSPYATIKFTEAIKN